MCKCRDYFCENHSVSIDNLFKSISDACIAAGRNCIPQSGAAKTSNIKVPHWNEYIEPHIECAMFWYTLWKDNGSPQNGILADIRRKTKFKYHYMIKWVKRNEINIGNDKLAEPVLDKCNSSLWSEVRKIKGQANYVPFNIDIVCGDGNIANLFAKKFSGLYNSAGYSDEDMMKIGYDED